MKIIMKERLKGRKKRSKQKKTKIEKKYPKEIN